MPDLFDQAFGATATKKDLFQEAFGAKKQTGNDLFGEAFGQANPQPNSLPALEAEAAQVGAPAPAQDSPGLFRRAMDLLMRGNYASAGAAEELFAPQGGGLTAVPGRVGSEIFSGIGGLEGKKKTFGQVLEESGVPEMGHFSDLAPFLYSDTGQGVPFQKGGWADPTGRGAIGLGLDIALDPTTYVGAGVAGKTARVGGKFLSKPGQKLYLREAAAALEETQKVTSVLGKSLGESFPALAREASIQTAKDRVQAAIEAGATNLLDKGGIKWAGIHIADNPLSSIANSGVAKELMARFGATKAGQMAAASTAWSNKYLVDPVANLIVKGWGVKGLEGSRQVMDDALNKEFANKVAAHESIRTSPLAEWWNLSTEKRDVIFKPVIDAFQEGGMASVPEKFKPAMEYYARKVDEMYGNEVSMGLLTREQKLQNYFAHYYRNDADELATVIWRDRGGLSDVKKEVQRLLEMGRNAEERAYPTLKAAIEGSTKLHGLDPTIPILRPIYDPIESLRRRWEHSITKRVNREMVDKLQRTYTDIPIGALYDLAKPAEYGANAAHKHAAVEALLASSPKDIRTEATTASKVFQTPELGLANQNLKAAWDSLPIKYRDQKILKNVDEVGYYTRRGWDVVEEGDNKYIAYTTNEVGKQEYKSFSWRLDRARRQVAAATKRATRDVEIPGRLEIGVDKLAALKGMSSESKHAYLAERFRRIGDRAELHNVLQRYQGMEEFFPKYVSKFSPYVAEDGTRFMPINFGGRTAVLPESLAREVAGMSDFVVKSRDARKILQGYDTVNNVWKGSVTWLFPAFHVRNLYSNVGQSFVDIALHALNPSSYIDTAKILFTKQPGVFKTALGDYTFDEVRQILNRHGINTEARALAEFTGNESKLLKPFKGAREVGTKIENESRAQLALNYLRRGMDPEDVGARVKKFQLDYANGLTSFERQWMKRIIPFYTFQRLNLGLQIDNLLKRPGMALTQVKPFLGRHSENEQMTSWDAGALKLRLNRDGKTVQMITGIDLPIRNLDLLFRGNVKDTMANAIGMLTPILKVPIEVAANKSLFTGNDFERANVPTAGRIIEQMPTSVQKWMGYQKIPDKAGRPQYTVDAQRYYLIGQSYITSRFLSTSDRQWRQYLQDASPGHLRSLLDMTTGLRFIDMNMDEEMKKKAAERQRDLEHALVRWGQRREFQRVFRPKGQ